MRVLGLDFTSSSSTAKSNHLVEAVLEHGVLRCESSRALGAPSELRDLLAAPGPWMLGIDFPFGLPHEFVAAQAWPVDWAGYATQATGLSLADFRATIEQFRAGRPEGTKQPGRRVDRAARSQSPLTTVRTPVANMFHAGVRWLLNAPCDVLPFRSTGAAAFVVEAYPALIVRRLVAGNRYKDGEASQIREVRDTLLRRIRRGDLREAYGFDVQVSAALVEQCLSDDHGDVLDSLLCAIQAAWAFTHRDSGWGIPDGVEHEGWITDPALADESGVLPAPPTGAFNSSVTRVQPVFRALLEADRAGRGWLPGLIGLANRNQSLARAFAATSCDIEPTSLQVHEVESPGRTREQLEGCFERRFAPPSALLAWCINNPGQLQRPRVRQEAAMAASGRGPRNALLGEAGPGQASAQSEGLRLLAERGADASRRAWWAFEGFTSVDCALETSEFLLLIEGKRFEPVSDSGSWVPRRNQIARNLEVASTYAREHDKDFAVLLVGPDGCQVPTDDVLRAGWPHLTHEQQSCLLDHLLGAASWRAVCATLGLNYEKLPLTAADIAAPPFSVAPPPSALNLEP